MTFSPANVPTQTATYEQVARSHWRAFESDEEHADRVEAHTDEANKLFHSVTVHALNVYHETMREIDAYKKSPMWDRKKADADQAWRAATAPAFDLFLRTFDQLMQTGEVTPALFAEWDALDNANKN